MALELGHQDWTWMLDDDCELVPGSLQKLIQAAVADSASRVAAVYPEISLGGGCGLAFDCAMGSGLADGMQWMTDNEGGVRWGPSTFVGIGTKAALEIEAFREGTFLHPCGGEDVDFGLRLEKAGWTAMGVRGAAVVHSASAWSRWRPNVRRAFRYGWAEAELIRLHRESTRGRASRQRRVLLRPVAQRAGELVLACAYHSGRVNHAARYRSWGALRCRFDFG